MIGFREDGLIFAFIIPLLLTVLLFLGPVCVHIYNWTLNDYTKRPSLLENLTNIIWLRNHIVAPFSEEFTFRACMIPLLLQSFKPMTTVLIQPMFFGVGKFNIISLL